MIRVLPFVIELILVVFCLIDCVQSDEQRIRNLPKWGWIILIVLVPIIGCVAWLLAGRPLRVSGERNVPWPSTKTAGFPEYERPERPRPKAPDDDPEFLARLKHDNSEHERLLKRWEEDLKRREDELRQDPDSGQKPDQS